MAQASNNQQSKFIFSQAPASKFFGIYFYSYSGHHFNSSLEHSLHFSLFGLIILYCLGNIMKSPQGPSNFKFDSAQPSNYRSSSQPQASTIMTKSTNNQNNDNLNIQRNMSFGFHAQSNDKASDTEAQRSPKETLVSPNHEKVGGLKPPAHPRKSTENQNPARLSAYLGVPEDRQSVRSFANISHDSIGSGSRGFEEGKSISRSRTSSRALLFNPADITENRAYSAERRTSKLNTSKSFVEGTQGHGVEWVHSMEKMFTNRSRRTSKNSNASDSGKKNDDERSRSSYRIVISEQLDLQSKSQSQMVYEETLVPSKANEFEIAQELKKSDAESESLKMRKLEDRTRGKGVNEDEETKLAEAERGDHAIAVRQFLESHKQQHDLEQTPEKKTLNVQQEGDNERNEEGYEEFSKRSENLSEGLNMKERIGLDNQEQGLTALHIDRSAQKRNLRMALESGENSNASIDPFGKEPQTAAFPDESLANQSKAAHQSYYFGSNSTPMKTSAKMVIIASGSISGTYPYFVREVMKRLPLQLCWRLEREKQTPPQMLRNQK